MTHHGKGVERPITSVLLGSREATELRQRPGGLRDSLRAMPGPKAPRPGERVAVLPLRRERAASYRSPARRVRVLACDRAARHGAFGLGG
jgi:hypothetical protein